jgi:membrane protease YdiL (CAAX protease family)
MSPFDDKSPDPPEQGPSLYSMAEPPPADAVADALPGDPIAHAASVPGSPYQPHRVLPEDLRISWSWPHFIIFMFFAFASFILVQTALALYYAPHQPLTQKQLEQYLLNKPQFLFGSNMLWYALIFLFLYVTLAVLRGLPFWASLGWKKLKYTVSPASSPWVYFFSGCLLAILVSVATLSIHTNDHAPIQEVLRNRNSAILLMSMAVLVAPLVEETVFRGYLYPLFAKSFGIVPGVLLTGILFGLMHGYQLGWTWGVVIMLVLVGITFTFARARTGTVLASFLLHLGYNSMIALAAVIQTHGFTQIPAAH